MGDPLNPGLIDVIDAALDKFSAGLWTAVPAVCEKYDKAQRLADCKPAVQRLLDASTDVRVYEELQTVFACPVLMLGGGGFRIELPVQRGSAGILLLSSLELASWLKTGVVPSKPGDVARNSLASGWFLPGIVIPSQVQPSAGVDDAIVFSLEPGGSALFGDHTAALKLAIDEEVRARLKDVFDAMTAAVPTANDGGANLKTTFLQYLTTTALWTGGNPPAMGTERVKVDS